MSYKISKYDAIKAVIEAEEGQNTKLASKMMQVIRRAARKEIKCEIYSKVYIINDNEKKYFERVCVQIKPNDDNE